MLCVMVHEPWVAVIVTVGVWRNLLFDRQELLPVPQYEMESPPYHPAPWSVIGPPFSFVSF